MTKNQIDVKNTSRLPPELVRELIEFARDGRDHGHVAVNVKNSSYSFRGRAYSQMPSISSRRRSKSRRYLVVVAVGADTQFPLRNTSYRGLSTAPVYDIVDVIEALVSVAAHELTHCQQFKQHAPISEIHAEQSSLRTLVRFREARLEGRLSVLAAWDMCMASAIVALEPMGLGSMLQGAETWPRIIPIHQAEYMQSYGRTTRDANVGTAG